MKELTNRKELISRTSIRDDSFEEIFLKIVKKAILLTFLTFWNFAKEKTKHTQTIKF